MEIEMKSIENSIKCISRSDAHLMMTNNHEIAAFKTHRDSCKLFRKQSNVRWKNRIDYHITAGHDDQQVINKGTEI